MEQTGYFPPQTIYPQYFCLILLSNLFVFRRAQAATGLLGPGELEACVKAALQPRQETHILLFLLLFLLLYVLILIMCLILHICLTQVLLRSARRAARKARAAEQSQRGPCGEVQRWTSASQGWSSTTVKGGPGSKPRSASPLQGESGTLESKSSHRPTTCWWGRGRA